MNRLRARIPIVTDTPSHNEKGLTKMRLTSLTKYRLPSFLALLMLAAICFVPYNNQPIASSPAGASVPAPAPFDLVSHETDPNGLPKNPKWGWQITHPSDFPDPNDLSICPNEDFSGPSCSTQPTSLDRGGPLSLGTCLLSSEPGRIRGHVNWAPATYEGTIFLESYNSMADGDYTFALKPNDNAGLTKKNPDFIHSEFDSIETLDLFQTPTWVQFRGFACGDTSGNCDKKKARAMIDGKRAIFAALVGLDSEHGGYSELHPVYIMAVEVKADPNDDVWMMFFRTWGDEGWCSHLPHPLVPDVTKLLIELPFLPGSHPTDVSAGPGTIFLSYPTAGSPLLALSAKGAIATFDLPQQSSYPKPLDGPIVEGELHLKWQLPPGETVPKLKPMERPASLNIEEVEDNPLGTDNLTPAETKIFLDAVRERKKAILSGAPKLQPLKKVLKNNELSAPLSGPQTNMQPPPPSVTSNPKYEDYRSVVAGALCKAAKAKVKGYKCPN